MATAIQLKTLERDLKAHRNEYFNKNKKLENIEEATTRILVNAFLKDVLNYKELEEIKTEARISRQYADYLLEVNNKKEMVVEVKSFSTTLVEKHLKQAETYALSAPVDWAILTNGREYQLYKVILGKPVRSKKLFSIDISKPLKKTELEALWLLTRAARKNKKELLNYWGRLKTSDPDKMNKLLYNENVVKTLRKLMKIESNIVFSDQEILDALYEIITRKLDSIKPSSVTKQKIR